MPRKKKIDDGRATDVAGAITVSLFLILLTFSISLNSIAFLDGRKILKTIGSLNGSFSSLPGRMSALNTGDSIMLKSSPLIEQKTDLERNLQGLDDNILGNVKMGKENDKRRSENYLCSRIVYRNSDGQGRIEQRYLKLTNEMEMGNETRQVVSDPIKHS